MILESFEIENWSCIRKATVSALPATGVVVLHAPNQTGKSSIVEALRATLFDFKPNSKDQGLKRFFPNWTEEPPRVTITFRVGEDRYRVTKKFKKGDGSLERETAGGWTTITRAQAEVHDQTLSLVGGKESDKGLTQLLWLPQTSYRLPTGGKFDPDVQAQLRNVLGVMQTPLDDSFIVKVKKNWATWHTPTSKPGEEPKRPKAFAQDKEKLDAAETNLARLDAEQQLIEKTLMRIEHLEGESRRLRGDFTRHEAEVQGLQAESTRIQARLEAFKLAELQVKNADAAVEDAKKKLGDRTAAEKLAKEAEAALEAAKDRADKTGRSLMETENALQEHRRRTAELLGQARLVRTEMNAADAQQRLIQHQTTLTDLEDKLKRAEELHQELVLLKDLDLREPAPDKKTLDELTANRTEVRKLEADLRAAAMVMNIVAEPGSSAAVEVDGVIETSGTKTWPVRRRAEVKIAGWGRIEIARGSDARGLDEVENDLEEHNRLFREKIAVYGLSGQDPAALDVLQKRLATRAIRAADRTRIEKDLKRLAPKAVEALRTEVAGLSTLIETLQKDFAGSPRLADPKGQADILREQFKKLEAEIEASTRAETETTLRIDAKPAGLRIQASQAQNDLATAEATARIRHENVERLPTHEQTSVALAAAEQNRSEARSALAAACLTEEEEALPGRLIAAADSLSQYKLRLDEVHKELHTLQGSVGKEGLHQERAEAAAVVDILKRKRDRDELDAKSYDRIYALFEECRQKQLSTVTGPVTDRVIRWMRLTGIIDYQSFECGDDFLPVSLHRKDGNGAMLLQNESTGAQEQIALMTRLALGSVLASSGEPAVAVLDDPLTHSDSGRLQRMRTVLKAAAAGDPHANPPAGPLQILVFTCHPEWFQVDSTTTIDLGNAANLDRI